MLYTLKDFESGAKGTFYVHCEDLIGRPGPHWHIPARILGIELDEFVKLLAVKYKATIVSYNKENKFLLFSWDKQSEARKYKNDINAQARKKGFEI